jgi:hypothetical protein
MNHLFCFEFGLCWCSFLFHFAMFSMNRLFCFELCLCWCFCVSFSFCCFAVFSMNHTHRPVAAQHANRNWVIRAVEYTTNCHPSPLAHWMTGYLCYQVHLFFGLLQMFLILELFFKGGTSFVSQHSSSSSSRNCSSSERFDFRMVFSFC